MPRNRALDQARSSEILARRLAAFESDAATEPPDGTDRFSDADLTLMFLCCHPKLSGTLQVCLILKAVAGFGVDEIAAAFLAKPATIQQRLVRARRALREGTTDLTLPDDANLEVRLGSVLRALYLMFNEGYAASVGDSPVRNELCGEAIRLGNALVGHPLADRPATHALLALMSLQASRLPARTNGTGAIVLLEEQDRALWDRRAIARGLRHLSHAAAGDTVTSYHLEAGIAMCHATAPSVVATDWASIVNLYDMPLAIQPTSVVRLNRAVAVASLRGPEAGLAELEGLDHDPSMQHYHLLFAVRAMLLARAGRWPEAAEEYASAASRCRTEPERALLEEPLTAARDHA